VLRLENVISELCSVKDLRPCCVSWELRGFLDAWGEGPGRPVRVRTDFAPVARRLYGLLRSAGADEAKVLRHKRRGFTVTADLPASPGGLPEAALPAAGCCRTSYVRGCFLARGYLNLSGRGYHWEIKTPGVRQAERVREVLESLGLPGVRVGRWQNGWVAYLKDADSIAGWLRLAGAHDTLLGFEDTRAKREMRNKVTRRVNYETANVDRIVAAAVRQTADIQLIRDTVGLSSLPPRLRALAEARLDQPAASLAELGQLLDPPLSKGGVSYRMRQIAAWADRLRQERAGRTLRRPTM